MSTHTGRVQTTFEGTDVGESHDHEQEGVLEGTGEGTGMGSGICEGAGNGIRLHLGLARLGSLGIG